MNETYYETGYYKSPRGSIMNKVYGEPGSWALGVFSIAFAFLGLNMFRIGTYLNLYNDGLLIGLIIGMIIHESAHKYAGRRNGCVSMYVATAWGVLVTIVSGFFPIKLLIPGFTSLMCFGRVSKEGEFEISSWGPLTNIALAIIAIVVYYIGIHSLFIQGFLVINVWLAVFNLLPIPPLDGWKMMKINPLKWGIMFVVSILLFFAPL
ncbi:MAG: hypothetical protein GSR79_00980 [Desulfurococcales archaeon]|nr:hypothetical protein [Desulfurococcales archaeon]